MPAPAASPLVFTCDPAAEGKRTPAECPACQQTQDRYDLSWGAISCNLKHHIRAEAFFAQQLMSGRKPADVVAEKKTYMARLDAEKLSAEAQLNKAYNDFMDCKARCRVRTSHLER